MKLGRKRKINKARALLDEDPAKAERILGHLLKKDPDDETISFLMGNALLRQNKIADAIKHFEKASQVNPGNLAALSNLASCLLYLSDDGRAVDVLTCAIQLAPENVALLYNRGIAHLMQKNYPEALNDLTNVLNKQQDHLGALLARANAFTAQGFLQEALDDLTRVITHSPTLPKTYMLRARILDQMGDLKSARDDVQLAISYGEESPAAYKIGGKICFGLQDYYNCINYLEKYDLMSPGDSEACVLLGKAYMELWNKRQNQADLDNSIRNFQKVLEREPENAAAFEGLTYAFIQSGKYSEAEALIDKIGAAQTGGASAMLLRAMLRAKSGRVDEAIAAIKEYLQLNPSDTNAREFLIRCLARKNEYVELLRHYEELKSLKIPSPEIVRLAAIAKEHSGSLEDAAELFNVALQGDPNDLQTQASYALCMSKVGKTEQAIEYSTKVIQGDSKNAIAYLARANAYAASGQQEKAIDDYQKAAELGLKKQALPRLAELYTATGQREKAVAILSTAYQLTGEKKFQSTMIKQIVIGGEPEKAIQILDREIEKKADVSLLKMRAKIKRQLGDLEGAKKDLERAAEIEISNPKIGLEIAKTLLKMSVTDDKNKLDLLDEAVHILNKTIEKDPSPIAYRLRAKAHEKMGELQKALEDATMVVNLEAPVTKKSLQKRVKLLKATGDYKTALEDIEKVLQIEPDSKEAITEKANLVSKTEGITASLKVIDQAMEKNPQEDSFKKMREIIVSLQKASSEEKQVESELEAASSKVNREQAFIEIRTAIGNVKIDLIPKKEIPPDDLEKYRYMVEIAAKSYIQGDFDAAVRAAESARAIADEESIVMLIAICNIKKWELSFCMDRSLHEIISKLLIGLVEKNPSVVHVKLLAYTHSAAQETEKAIELYGAVLAKVDDDLDAILGRGNCYIRKKEYEKAVSDFSKAFNIRRSSPEALAGRGLARLMQWKLAGKPRRSGQLTMATMDLNNCVYTHPGYAEGWKNRAAMNFEFGNYADAISDLLHAISLDPRLIEAYKLLIDSYFQVKKFSEAVHVAKGAIEINPYDAELMSKYGASLLATGKKKEALAAFMAAARLSPEYAAKLSAYITALESE